jgi:hypothetical protein
MQITCGICLHHGDAESFLPENVGMLPDDLSSPGPDWVCPHCLCGIYAPRTLTVDDFICIDEVDDEKAV